MTLSEGRRDVVRLACDECLRKWTPISDSGGELGSKNGVKLCAKEGLSEGLEGEWDCEFACTLSVR